MEERKLYEFCIYEVIGLKKETRKVLNDRIYSVMAYYLTEEQYKHMTSKLFRYVRDIDDKFYVFIDREKIIDRRHINETITEIVQSIDTISNLTSCICLDIDIAYDSKTNKAEIMSWEDDFSTFEFCRTIQVLDYSDDIDSIYYDLSIEIVIPIYEKSNELLDNMIKEYYKKFISKNIQKKIESLRSVDKYLQNISIANIDFHVEEGEEE